MTAPYQRIATLMLCALLLVGCKSELYSDLSEREANQIIAALSEIGIPSSKSVSGEGVTVMVDQSRFSEAVQLLNARGLPSQEYQSFGDVFRKEGIVSSPIEERARYIYALSQELSRTIAEIDGVLSARIHVVLPETDMLGRDFKPSSASVFIRHAPDAAVANFSSQIKLLVANSIEGLVYDNVTVVSVPAAAKEVPQAQAPVLQDIAGIWVHPNSVQRFWILLGVLAGVSVLAVAGAVVTIVSGRRARAGVEEFDRV